MRAHLFRVEQPTHRPVTWGDVVVFVGVVVLIYAGGGLALDAPAVVKGPTISLSARVLPWYAGLSVAHMAAAYALFMLFTLVYGYLAAYNRRAEQILMPLLDVLQSVPILSFLLVVLLSFSTILPEKVAAKLASIVLIFTSQAWNLTFALRFKALELPFAAISLLWNSMMSWAGGWFFLMAAEIFTVGQRDFRWPGLGAYLQEAANQGDLRAVAWGVGTLVLLIITLDQLAWRPLLAWADRFKLEMVESDNPPASWFYDLLHGSRLADWLPRTVWQPVGERLDAWLLRRFPAGGERGATGAGRPWVLYLVTAAVALSLLYGAYRAGLMWLSVPLAQWTSIGAGVAATLLRAMASLVIALAWTVPRWPSS